ncbi:hypothetical protein VNO77_34118 [Canavalia gladiata]|uniref:Uncharacterized protein n=1 Tax=Canavalia gladiata TaxID=3824 RepID=A0AAN9KD38_CANGL
MVRCKVIHFHKTNCAICTCFQVNVNLSILEKNTYCFPSLSLEPENLLVHQIEFSDEVVDCICNLHHICNL